MITIYVKYSTFCITVTPPTSTGNYGFHFGVSFILFEYYFKTFVYRTCSFAICLTSVFIKKCVAAMCASLKVFITLLSMLNTVVIIFVIFIS